MDVHHSGLFVIQDEETLLVDRLSHGGDAWWLTNDNPSYPNRPFTDAMLIHGEIKWAERTV